MREERVLRELLSLFNREEIPVGVRAAAADELGESRFVPAKDALLAGLENPDPVMRRSCILALALGFKAAEAAPKLMQILADDDTDFVKLDAALGLGHLRSREALTTLKRIVLDEGQGDDLRETAYEAILSILGLDDGRGEHDLARPISIDFDLIRRLN